MHAWATTWGPCEYVTVHAKVPPSYSFCANSCRWKGNIVFIDDQIPWPHAHSPCYQQQREVKRGEQLNFLTPSMPLISTPGEVTCWSGLSRCMIGSSTILWSSWPGRGISPTSTISSSGKQERVGNVELSFAHRASLRETLTCTIPSWFIVRLNNYEPWNDKEKTQTNEQEKSIGVQPHSVIRSQEMTT